METSLLLVGMQCAVPFALHHFGQLLNQQAFKSNLCWGLQLVCDTLQLLWAMLLDGVMGGMLFFMAMRNSQVVSTLRMLLFVVIWIVCLDLRIQV